MKGAIKTVYHNINQIVSLLPIDGVNHQKLAWKKRKIGVQCGWSDDLKQLFPYRSHILSCSLLYWAKKCKNRQKNLFSWGMYQRKCVCMEEMIDQLFL